jgi:hypothetical protein
MKRKILLGASCGALVVAALAPWSASQASNVSVGVSTPEFGIRIGAPYLPPVFAPVPQPVPVYYPRPYGYVPPPVVVYAPPPRVYGPPPECVEVRRIPNPRKIFARAHRNRQRGPRVRCQRR